MKWPNPLKNSLEAVHPVCALKNMCFEAADRERERADAGDEAAMRKMLVYGKLWHVLLIVWDELNGQHDYPGCPEFEEALMMTFSSDLDDIQVYMYG